jgi:hypothetical protein
VNNEFPCSYLFVRIEPKERHVVCPAGKVGEGALDFCTLPNPLCPLHTCCLSKPRGTKSGQELGAGRIDMNLNLRGVTLRMGLLF